MLHSPSVKVQALNIIPMISGSLSIIGSSLTIYIILSDRKRKLPLIFYRLILGMTIFDISTAFGCFMSSIPVPMHRESVMEDKAWFAAGNDVTCTVQGFLFQLGFTVVYYNSALMLYYLLRIKYNKNEMWIKTHFERWIHMFAIFMALGSSISGVFLQVYNPGTTICLVAPSPLGCIGNPDVSCERGKYVFIFMLSTHIIWMLASVLCMCISLWMVWNSIRNRERIMEKYGVYMSQQKSIQKPKESKTKQQLSNSSTLANNSFLCSVILEDTRLRSNRGHRPKKSKQFQTQAYRYFIIYILCCSWPTIGFFTRRYYFHSFVHFLSSFFYPLQGFLNYLNFIHPKVQRILKWQEATNVFHALFLATFVPDHKQLRLRRQNRVVQEAMKRHSERQYSTQKEEIEAGKVIT